LHNFEAVATFFFIFKTYIRQRSAANSEVEVYTFVQKCMAEFMAIVRKFKSIAKERKLQLRYLSGSLLVMF